MNTPLSLVQELRGIRGGQKHNQADLEGLLSEIREARREWQVQVDQAQHLFQELMSGLASLSGVELPGMAIDAQKDGDGSLRLGFKTLKDRIRNELEGFASTSAAEIAKEAQSKSGTLFEPLEKEMSARMDNLADEFREKVKARLELEQNEVANEARVRTEEMLQGKMNDFAEWIKLMTEGTVSSVPAEVQKSLEPHVEQVKARLKNTFQQHLNMVAMESERASQIKIEAIKGEIQALMDGLSEQARQTCSRSAEQAMKEFHDRITGAVQESARQLEEGSRGDTEKNLQVFKSQLEGLATTAIQELQSFADSRLSGFKDKLEVSAQELQQKSAADIAGKVQEASQEALNSSLTQVKQRMDEALESSKGELQSTMSKMSDDVRKQISDTAMSARDSLAGDATRLSDSLKGIGEQLKASEGQRIDAMAESMANLSRQTLERHAQSVQQIADAHVEEIRKSLSALQTGMASDYEAQLRQYMEVQRKTMLDEVQRQVQQASAGAVDQIRESSSQVVQDLSGKVNKEVNTATTLLNQWAHQTTTWAEASIKESLESYKRQVGEFTGALLEEQRATIQARISDLQGRLEQASNLLRVSDGATSSMPLAPERQKV